MTKRTTVEDVLRVYLNSNPNMPLEIQWSKDYFHDREIHNASEWAEMIAMGDVVYDSYSENGSLEVAELVKRTIKSVNGIMNWDEKHNIPDYGNLSYIEIYC